MYQPQFYTIVSGVGKSAFALVSFDNALRHAGIGDYNLVKVSSILPPDCKYCEKISVAKGSVVYAAYSTITIKNGERGQTAVATAVPNSSDESGVIFESSSICANKDEDEMVQKMCIEAMKNRGKPISYIKHLSQKIIGEKDLFTSAISAVIMW